MSEGRSEAEAGVLLPANPVSIVDIFKTKGFGHWVFADILSLAASVMPLTFMYTYGAKYFGHCSAKEKAEDDDDCEYDYVQYAMWSAASMSFWYLMAFLRSPAAGRFADRNGRRTLYIVQLALSTLPLLPLLAGRQFTPVFLFLYGFGGLMGRFPIPFQAAVSDMFEPDKRTVAYSLLIGLQNIGLFFGAGMSIALGMLKGAGDLPKIIGALVLTVFSIVYAYALLPETLNTKQQGDDEPTPDCKDPSVAVAAATAVRGADDAEIDPMSDVTKMETESFVERYILCHEIRALWNVPGLMRWICFIDALQSFVMSGFMFTFPPYVLHLMHVRNDNKAVAITAVCNSTMAMAAALGVGAFVPFLRSKFAVSDIWIVKYGFVCLCAMCVVATGIAVNGPQRFPLAIVICALCAQGYASEAALSRIITAVVPGNEQATAFGVFSSWTAAACCLGPVSFGLLLAGSNKLGASWLMPLPALALILTALWLTHFRLKPGCTSHKSLVQMSIISVSLEH